MNIKEEHLQVQPSTRSRTQTRRCTYEKQQINKFKNGDIFEDRATREDAIVDVFKPSRSEESLAYTKGNFSQLKLSCN